jgi:hypothetical protein
LSVLAIAAVFLPNDLDDVRALRRRCSFCPFQERSDPCGAASYFKLAADGWNGITHAWAEQRS